MLKWHFVEEIEHREVVYDLMQEIKISSNQKTIASLMAFSSFCFWITLVSLILRLNQAPRPLLDPIYWKSQGEGLPFLRMLRAASAFT
jgi:predicted metal-dependent hydrolase